MAYQIQYDAKSKQKNKPKGPKWRFPALIAGFFLLFVLCAEQTRPEQTAAVRAMLLPESVRQEVQELIDDLRNGENVTESVTVFYRDIFDGQ